MRMLLILALVFGAQLGMLPAAARAQSAADDEAIKRVLLAETDHFFARNFEAWAATFVQVPSATRTGPTCTATAGRRSARGSASS
jgi:hypothetical protein